MRAILWSSKVPTHLRPLNIACDLIIILQDHLSLKLDNCLFLKGRFSSFVKYHELNWFHGCYSILNERHYFSSYRIVLEVQLKSTPAHNWLLETPRKTCGQDKWHPNRWHFSCGHQVTNRKSFGQCSASPSQVLPEYCDLLKLPF